MAVPLQCLQIPESELQKVQSRCLSLLLYQSRAPSCLFLQGELHCCVRLHYPLCRQLLRQRRVDQSQVLHLSSRQKPPISRLLLRHQPCLRQGVGMTSSCSNVSHCFHVFPGKFQVV